MEKIIGLLICLFLFVAYAPGHAQNYQIDNTQTEEVLDLFSSFATGGYFHSAKCHRLGGLDIGLRGVAVFVPDKYKDIIGDPFEDVNFVALPYLHASLGLPFNFEVMGRVFHFPMGDEPTDGAVTSFGGGLKYGLFQIPMLPKIAVIGAYHTFRVPEEYTFGKVETLSLKAVASYALASLTLYGGFGVDRSTTVSEIDDESYSSQSTHSTIGVNFKLSTLRFNADYNFGEFGGFNFGLGVDFD